MLSTEQKKTDFKPEDESVPLQMYSKVGFSFLCFFCESAGEVDRSNTWISWGKLCSFVFKSAEQFEWRPKLKFTVFGFAQACEKVVSYVGGNVEPIKLGLDGKNVEATLLEFGIRFHRVVYDHLQQYQYNSMGAQPLESCVIVETTIKCLTKYSRKMRFPRRRPPRYANQACQVKMLIECGFVQKNFENLIHF